MLLSHDITNNIIILNYLQTYGCFEINMIKINSKIKFEVVIGIE